LTRVAFIDRALHNQQPSAEGALRLESSYGKTLQEFRNFMDQELSSSIVKHARFVLHTNETSEARILLKPPELGTMRLRLFMHHDTIHGKIVVDSHFAKDIIEQNIADIQKLLRNQGLQNGIIDVDVNPHSHSASYRHTTEHTDSSIVHKEEVRSSEYDLHREVTKNNDIDIDSLLINLYA